MHKSLLVITFWSLFSSCLYSQTLDRIIRINNPDNPLSPKSIRHNGNGIFSAQNMMYNHSIHFYDRSFNVIHTIEDAVNLSHYGYCEKDNIYKGAPVECVYSSDGRYAYVSNYKMYGKGFSYEAYDNCQIDKDSESSFVYKIDVSNFKIEEVFEVGSVPKYLCLIETHGVLAVSNWCSGSISFIDLKTGNTIDEVSVGRYPRGLSYSNGLLYVAIMGSNLIKVISLENLKTIQEILIGNGPRDIRIDSQGKYLYASLNREHAIVQYDIENKKLMGKIRVGKYPRSMCFDGDETSLFFTLYGENKVGALSIPALNQTEHFATCAKPIGIDFDKKKKQLWVACYSGYIDVFQFEKKAYSEQKVSSAVKPDQLKILEDRPEEVPIKTKPVKQNTEMFSNSISGKMKLICGSFSVRENGVKRVEQLKKDFPSARVETENALYRVVVLSNDDRDHLKKAGEKLLISHGLKSWIKE